ncbi:MAG: SIMPL domain-containing protein, partial [Porticoccus sp.]|nr:SIMPL domain-containing protein [Porticoccus sp.]
MHKLLILPLLLLTLACQAHDDPNRRLISTNGYGEVKVKPDIAIVNLSVRAIHKSGKAAKLDVDDRVNNFLDSLENMNIKQEDIMKTRSITWTVSTFAAAAMAIALTIPSTFAAVITIV